jgi:hypothetical protein
MSTAEVPAKPSPEQLEAELSRDADAEPRLASQVRRVVGDYERTRRGRDRTIISIAVMLLYVISILAYIVYLLIKGLWCGQDVASALLDAIKTVVIPVVTFVLGYYFATARSD